MVFLRRGDIFGDAASEEVGGCLGGQGGEEVVGWGLRFRRWGWKKGFGVGWEVLAAVGGIETFRKNDQVGTGARGFQDLGAGVAEVGGFVGTWLGKVSRGVVVGRGKEDGDRGYLLLAARGRASRVSLGDVPLLIDF